MAAAKESKYFFNQQQASSSSSQAKLIIRLNYAWFKYALETSYDYIFKIYLLFLQLKLILLQIRFKRLKNEKKKK